MSAKMRDALNRAVRTIWQFILVDVVLVVVPLVNDAIDRGDSVDWGRLGLLAVRAALGGLLAYVMRLKLPPAETPPAAR